MRCAAVLPSVLAMAWTVSLVPVVAAGPQQDAPAPVGAHRALLERYCITCHNPALSARGTVPIELETADLGDVPGAAELWEKVIRKLRTGTMPAAAGRTRRPPMRSPRGWRPRSTAPRRRAPTPGGPSRSIG